MAFQTFGDIAEKIVQRLLVGQVFYTSWGYEQTNIDFYEVVDVPSPATVVIRKIARKAVRETGWASEDVVAEPGRYIGEPTRVRIVNGYRSPTFYPEGSKSSVGLAHPYDGIPVHRSWYA